MPLSATRSQSATIAVRLGPSAQNRGGTHRLIPELDGVRGLAVLLVMLCHSTMIQAPPESVPFILRNALFLGWSGVDLFFVLSGFLITGILLDSRGSSNYFSSFYARRVLRIFPLYFISVLAYFHLALPLAHHFGQWKAFTNSLEMWFWIHLSNWKLAFGEDGGRLSHFWSLAIEEQFYLFWPLVVFFAGRRRLPYVCLALIGISFGLRCFYAHNDFGIWFLYCLTPFRVEPLAVGSLAAVLVRNGRTLAMLRDSRLLAGVAAVGVILLFAVLLTGRSVDFGTPLMATLGFTSFAIIYGCLVLFAYMQSGSPDWLVSQLRRPVLRAFGKYSYAIYVFHVPLFVMYGRFLPARLGFIFWFLAVVGAIGLSYGLALVSWHLVEKHFWGLKRRFSVKFTVPGVEELC